MKAAIRERYGLEAIEVRDIEKPAVGDNDVLVRVRAASVNPTDWYAATGRAAIRVFERALFKPKNERIGTDFAGVVETVGKEVERFQPGDEVYGARTGAFAEYVVVSADRAIAQKPRNLTFEEAAAAPIAAITALQALRDKAKVKAGEKVLINGASGGVGPYAVQIAKQLGADVTAVCSTRNVEQARSLGADRIVDYTREDFAKSAERYDVVVDVVGSRRLSTYKSILKPNARFIVIGAPKSRPLRHAAKMILASKVRREPKIMFFVANLNGQDLQFLAQEFATGRLKSMIDRRFELADIRAAFDYLGEGHA